MNTRPLSELGRQLDYEFSNVSLLHEALTHRSAGSTNNERMEFLGDSVLNFVISHELYKMYPDMREGDLSRLRASLVNGDTLAEIGLELKLGDYITLGVGELKSGGHRRTSILADCVESIIGAVYCDSDFNRCRTLILRLYINKLKNIPDVQTLKDPKTRLQELLQSRQHQLPQYEVVNVTGKAHDQTFEVTCSILNPVITTQGTGRSRRKAEQNAAQLAIEQVQQQYAQTANRSNK